MSAPYVCQACEWRGDDEGAAGMHEHNRHDGAQTCWPTDDES